MLVAMRHALNSVFAKIFLFGILILSFGLWGIADIFVPGASQDTVAEVGEQVIRAQDVSRVLNRDIAQLGLAQLDRQQLRRLGLVDSALERLIAPAVVRDRVVRLGLRAGDEAVRAAIVSDDRFHNSFGQFDRNRFVGILGNVGLNEDAYVEALRSDIAGQWVFDALAGHGGLSPRAMSVLREYRLGMRDVRLFRAGVPLGEGEPEAGELAEFFAGSREQFRWGESRVVRFVRIVPEQYTDTVVVSEEDMRASFAAREAEFQQPEQRGWRRILFSDKADADAAWALVRGGEDFGRLPEALDGEAEIVTFAPSSAAEFGVPELAAAIFAAAPGEVMAPIETNFGWSLAVVDEVIPALAQSFEDVRAVLAAELRLQAAQEAAFDAARIFDDALGGGASLAAGAAVIAAEVVTMAAIDASGRTVSGEVAQGLPQAAEFLQNVFLLEEGEQSLLIEVEADRYFVAEVVEIIAPRVPALEEILPRVRAAWRAEQVRERAQAQAAAWAEEIRTGVALEDVAVRAGAEVEEIAGLSRLGADAAGWDLGADVLEQVMALGAAGDVVGALAPRAPGQVPAQAPGQIVPGQIVVAQLDRVHPLPVHSTESRESTFADAAISAHLARLAATVIRQQWRAQSHVRIYQAVIDNIL